MPLAPGTRVGPYEILSPLGAGGMGEVWKARDTRLNRLVASILKETPRPLFELDPRTPRGLAEVVRSLYEISTDWWTGYVESVEAETDER